MSGCKSGYDTRKRAAEGGDVRSRRSKAGRREFVEPELVAPES